MIVELTKPELEPEQLWLDALTMQPDLTHSTMPACVGGVFVTRQLRHRPACLSSKELPRVHFVSAHSACVG